MDYNDNFSDKNNILYVKKEPWKKYCFQIAVFFIIIGGLIWCALNIEKIQSQYNNKTTPDCNYTSVSELAQSLQDDQISTMGDYYQKPINIHGQIHEIDIPNNTILLYSQTGMNVGVKVKIHFKEGSKTALSLVNYKIRDKARIIGVCEKINNEEVIISAKTIKKITADDKEE